MKLNELFPNPGSVKPKKRLGIGIGSGKGKTAGRGMKGQKARSGVSIKGFEGGQMPIFRRLPKRGFNPINRQEVTIIHLSVLFNKLKDEKLSKEVINNELLQKLGLIKRITDAAKILYDQDIAGKIKLAEEVATSKAVKAFVEA